METYRSYEKKGLSYSRICRLFLAGALLVWLIRFAVEAVTIIWLCGQPESAIQLTETVVRISEENLECYKGLSFAVCQPDGGIYREDRMAPGFDGSLWEMDLPDGNGASGISSAVFC